MPPNRDPALDAPLTEAQLAASRPRELPATQVHIGRWQMPTGGGTVYVTPVEDDEDGATR